MRTALVFSALLIVDAINNYQSFIDKISKDTFDDMVIFVVIIMVMDILEFFSNLSKRSN